MTYKLVTAVPTVDTAVYASGDAVGGMLTFSDVCPNYDPSFDIVSALLVDKAKQSALLRLILFSTTFTPTADQAPFDPSDTDAQNIIGYVTWAAADYVAFNDSSFAQKGGDLGAILGISGRLVDNGIHLYGQLVSYGTPTYAAATDLTIKLLIRR